MKYLVSALLVLILIVSISCSNNGNESPTSSLTLNLNGNTVKIEPGPGNLFFNSQGESNYVLLKEVSISMGIAEQDYFVQKVDLPNIFKKGEPIILIKGIVQNKHPEYHEIAMGAQGFDKNGKQVCWTLDPFGPGGIVELSVEPEQEGEFIIHLNFSEYVDFIHISGGVTKIPLP